MGQDRVRPQPPTVSALTASDERAAACEGAGDARVPRDGRAAVAGPVNEPLLDVTIPALLARTVAAAPEGEAAVFVEAGVRWSWAELARRVDALAGGLLALGLAPGDRIGIWSPNRPEWLLAQFATARVGLVLVNVNPAYRTAELEFALAKVGCRALITAERFKTSDYVGMLGEVAPRLPALAFVVTTGTGEAPDGTAAESVKPAEGRRESGGRGRGEGAAGGEGRARWLGFADVAGAAPDEPLPGGVDTLALDRITATLSPDDPINIQFTSGTTGLPKGATLSHRNIVNNAHFVTGAMRLTDDDRLCIPVPFYHCFGMVMGTLGCVARGATMVVPSEGFDAAATLRAVGTERCTALYGVPTMFVAMLDHPEFASTDVSALRTGIMAGSPCPIEVMKRVQSTMNMREVTIAYGMTETSPVSFQSGVDDPLDKRVSSVGQVHPHVEVKIVDEAGEIVGVGEQGELCTRGYSVMTGYWDEPEQTAAVIDADGWMHTGDLATLDAEGFCNITGRVKDMIVRGGENVYPREIEEFLYAMPGVAQVQVFGIPDARYGEAVCAWVVPKAGAGHPDDAGATGEDVVTADGVRAFCEGRISHFKVPARVEIVAEIPMTVTGKAQKFVMRERMVEKLGLVETATA